MGSSDFSTPRPAGWPAGQPTSPPPETQEEGEVGLWIVPLVNLGGERIDSGSTSELVFSTRRG